MNKFQPGGNVAPPAHQFRYRTIEGWILISSHWHWKIDEQGSLVILDEQLRIWQVWAAGEWFEIQRIAE